MAPGISIREHIQWAGEPASEPTSTIVVTSPGSRFVDLRIFKEESPSTENSTSSSDLNLPFPRLDWAIAGTTHTEPLSGGRDGVHSTWRHWISSRTERPDNVADEGDMFPVPGAPDQTLEQGTMENPTTGKLQAYEEIWRDEVPVATSSEGGEIEFAVLQVQDDVNATRGSVVRLGQFCQGIVRIGHRVGLERWAWDARRGWQLDVRMGELKMPCSLAVGGNSHVEVGKKIEFGGLSWAVIESGTL